MFEAEARWLRGALESYPVERLSPLLNLGSSDSRFRETVQPWIEREVFAPLRARGVEIAHVDRRDGPGIDLRSDLTDPGDIARLRERTPRAILCCNLLEHVMQPEVLARNCLQLLGSGGLAFVTVPFSYPYHRDPIDTMYRPNPDELATLFPKALMREGLILGAGTCYRDELRRRPALLLRHLARFPLPVPFAPWRRSMTKLISMNAEYRITCAVFEKR
jgi:hypothetical protein